MCYNLKVSQFQRNVHTLHTKATLQFLQVLILSELKRGIYYVEYKKLLNREIIEFIIEIRLTKPVYCFFINICLINNINLSQNRYDF